MALSDYERRVLDEIEAELRLRPARKWHPRRALIQIAASILVAAGLLTLAALVLPAGLDVAMAAVVGIALGYLVAITVRRRPGRGARGSGEAGGRPGGPDGSGGPPGERPAQGA